MVARPLTERRVFESGPTTASLVFKESCRAPSLCLTQNRRRKVFTVRGYSHEPGTVSVTVSKATREDALATAIEMLEQGIPIVTIIGDGRTYTTTEFALIFGNE